MLYEKLGLTLIPQFFQHNDKLPLPQWKQGNYLLTHIHAQNTSLCPLYTYAYSYYSMYKHILR